MKFATLLIAGAAAASACAFFSSSANAAAPSDPVARVIAQSRAALGATALKATHVLEVHQTVSFGGLNGTNTAYVEVGGTRFAENASTPPIDEGDGYDGKQVWNSDGTGLVWIDGGTMGRSQEIAQAYVNDYALWTAGRGGATVTFAGVKQESGTSYDVLSIAAPNVALPFELWFDRKSHFPVRFVQTIGTISQTLTFSKYRVVDGLMYPFASTFASNDGNSGSASVTEIFPNPPGANAMLAKPKTKPHDFSIAGGGSETKVPIELSENHVYLDVMLNGKGPYRFIYDTGGANIIDPAVAAEIGATGHGSLQGNGVGSTTESVSFAKVASLRVGDAVLTDQLFGVAPVRMGFGMSAGQKVDGLIGFEVLSRFVTTFDYANNVVILRLPATQTALPAAAQVLPFALDSRQPQFACSIDGIASQCTLDTGARDTLELMTPFIADHPQVVPSTLTSAGVNGFGVGGPSLGKLGRLSSFKVGPFTFNDLIAGYSTQDKGAFTVPFIAANVGGNFWRRFSLTLDYDTQLMTLVPNAALDERDAYDRSGLFLIARDGRYLVIDARAGAPAAAAGIVKGDQIATVDGAPAASMTLQALRERLAGAPGTKIVLGIVGKDGATRTVTLFLNDFV